MNFSPSLAVRWPKLQLLWDAPESREDRLEPLYLTILVWAKRSYRGNFVLQKQVVEFALKNYLSLHQRSGRDHRGPACVFDDDSHPRQPVGIE